VNIGTTPANTTSSNGNNPEQNPDLSNVTFQRAAEFIKDTMPTIVDTNHLIYIVPPGFTVKVAVRSTRPGASRYDPLNLQWPDMT